MYEENENLKQMVDFVFFENIKSFCKMEDNFGKKWIINMKLWIIIFYILNFYLVNIDVRFLQKI